MSFEAYNAILKFDKTYCDATSQYKENYQAIKNDGFEIASNYYVIKHRSRITNSILSATPVWNDVGVRLVTPFQVKRTTLIKDDYFKIIFKSPDYDVKLGDVFSFNNYRWIVTNTSLINELSRSVLVQRCNLKLRFTETEDLTSNIIEIDAAGTKYLIEDLESNQFITLPDNSMHVILPSDYNGVKVQWTYGGGTRFLLGNPYQNWRTISYDNISLKRDGLDGDNENGLIKIKLELSEVNPGLDNLVNGVAWQDYF